MKNEINILIVEDDIFTAQNIEKKLIQMGYSSLVIAISYKQAIFNIKKETPDLILLDLHLKDGNTGLDIAYEKKVFQKIPIIYITGDKDSKTLESLRPTKPKGYLSKPLKYEELEFYVSLALESNDKKDTISIGHEFSYNLEKRELLQKKESIHLTPHEKFLLEILIAKKGTFILPKALKFKIWGYDAKETSSLRTLVFNLRKKLNPEKLDYEMIENDQTFGYKLIIPKDKI